tara:strand:- start:1121 stop:2725 length:1605 start_codon:yes stop_codon:yes gene_type:complete
MSAFVPDKFQKNIKRTWSQKFFLISGLFLSVILVLLSFRLNAFEDAVESIVRIEVPTGVLADLPDNSKSYESNVEGTDSENNFKDDRKLEPHPAGPARNFLLVGTDSAVGLEPDDPAANRDRSAGIGLADTIMVVRLDPALAKASIMSLPRDLYVTIYRDGVPVRSEKLASALLVGGIEKGAPTLVETITRNFDIPIHNFAIVDFFGFEQLVEELSGVPLWFPYPLRDLASGLKVIEAGCSVLDGRQSLAFVRSRKMEAFVGGEWYRVGVWNDLERNQRQQDFLIRTIQRAISNGARSLLIRDDLIRAGAEAVVFDDRLTIAELLQLGRRFSEFEPKNLKRYVLPVSDMTVGGSEVLKLGDNAIMSFGVFRGEAFIPESLSITALDARSVSDRSDEIFADLELKGFDIEIKMGEPQDRTTIYSSTENYDAAVLLGRFIQPTPDFYFDEKLKDEIILILGDDFEAFPLLPKSVEEVDLKSRASLPVHDENTNINEIELGFTNSYKSAIPLRQGDVSPRELVREINGQPPSGVKCE